MEQNYDFNMEKVNGLEMYGILKPELIKAFNKHYGESYNDLEFVHRGNWFKDEKDGKNYPIITLQVLAYKGYDRWVGTYFVIKLTPFDCYFSEDRIMNGNIQAIGGLRNKELTKFYRQQMQSKYGKEWTEAFNAYINRVKQYRQDILNEAYNESMKKIENDIKEEQTF